jgi:Flp pilus assembly protein TadG
MGAVTVANVKRLGPSPWNMNRQLVRATVTWSSSYATGGDTLATVMLSTLGLRQINKVMTLGQTDPFGAAGDATSPVQMTGGSYEVRLAGTLTAPLLILRKGGTTPVEESNATNVSGVSATLIFEGQV